MRLSYSHQWLRSLHQHRRRLQHPGLLVRPPSFLLTLIPQPPLYSPTPPPLSTAYFGIALSLCIYFGWKLFKRPALRKATDMDLTSGLEEIDADEEYWKQNYQPPTTRWGKFVDWLL